MAGNCKQKQALLLQDRISASVTSAALLYPIHIVSCGVCVSGVLPHQLCVELGQARLAIVVEHQHGADHDGEGTRLKGERVCGQREWQRPAQSIINQW